MFYIEGTIDSLEFEIRHFKLNRFSLVPSSEFMITLPDGTKKALFVDSFGKNDCERTVASLTKAETKGTGKDVVYFEMHSLSSQVLIDILVQAKYNSSKIGVCVGRRNDEKDNAILHPDLADVVEIHLV